MAGVAEVLMFGNRMAPIGVAGALGLMVSQTALGDDKSLSEAIAGGKAYLTFNSRYEFVDQDNPLDEASALTLLTRFGYKTDSWNNLSAHVEFEDSRILFGFDEFSIDRL